jgi:hypothetical protein
MPDGCFNDLSARSQALHTQIGKPRERSLQLAKPEAFSLIYSLLE